MQYLLDHEIDLNSLMSEVGTTVSDIRNMIRPVIIQRIDDTTKELRQLGVQDA
jgi:hypothetical protein